MGGAFLHFEATHTNDFLIRKRASRRLDKISTAWYNTLMRNTNEKGNTMTNNNNKKATNCACGDMGVSEFVAGNQCFRCEQVDNRHAGITFTTGVCGEWDAWFKQIGERVVAFKAGPNYIDPSRYANGEPRDEPRPEPMQWKHYD